MNEMTHRDEIRKNSLTIPMSKEEKDAIRAEAKKAGLTMATYARIKLFDILREEK
ncbi:MAG: hypothetical protein KBT46_03545 [Ruminococcus sp.]|nr:hypothetical protein [Candidatus Copronaster equi]